MGGSEQVGKVVTLSGAGVTLRKEFVRDEYTVPTIRFVVDNESDEARTVEITEAVPEGYSVDAVGFHPEYGAEYWTCYEDERAEFERDVPRNTTYETVYGVRIEDPLEAEAFMTEPRLIVDGESIGDADAAGHGGSETEVEKELLDDAERASTNGTGTDDGRSGEGAAAGDAATKVTAAAVPGPETGSVIERLVEELRRNDVDAEQREVLREQLDLGVPSETKARIEQLGTRVETIAAYADALEEFLDEEGTAQEVIHDFETQVDALREDVATIREETASNAGEIAEVDGDLGALESQVEDLEGTVSAVADRADDLEDSLSTTDSHIETVEADLRGTEERISTNDEAIGDLDADLTAVEDDLDAVDERVSATEANVDTLDEAAAELRTDLDDVEGDVDDLEATAADTADDVADLEGDLATLDDDLDELQADLAGVRDDVESLNAWRAELGEMFQ